MKIHDFKSMKERQEKITMITCYDHCFAQIIEQYGMRPTD